MADEFAEAVGGFCWNFSILESKVRDALYHLARLPPKIGNAILSGTRAKESLDCITRLSDVFCWSEDQKSELAAIKQQFGLINDLRNDILHYGAYRMGDDYIVSNRQAVHIDARLKESRISAETLKFASADLYQIDLRLLQLVFTDLDWPSEIRDHLRSSLSASWQYKQPPRAWK
jgi:hypothetical protein